MGSVPPSYSKGGVHDGTPLAESPPANISR